VVLLVEPSDELRDDALERMSSSLQ